MFMIDLAISMISLGRTSIWSVVLQRPKWSWKIPCL